ncbi:MAG: SpoIIE family protein phosphatase [Clostridia bacterium]|nr:SpoIIE family protein phosphatase [Clostridia bacterium]
MTIRKPFPYARMGVYALYLFAALCFRHIGDNGEPFALALCYAFCSAGFSPIVCGGVYTASALFGGTPTEVLICAVQAFLLAVAFFAQRKNERLQKSNLLPLLALSLSLGGYVGLIAFTPYVLPIDIPFLLDALTQKVLICAVIFLLSASFSVAVKCLLKKVLRCRLRMDEVVFCVLLFVFFGIGICRFLGFNAYMGMAFFALLLFAAATKDSTVLFCAFTLSLPPLCVLGFSLKRFFIYGIIVALFIRSGRLAAALALLTVFFAYAFFDGTYALETPFLVQSILSAVVPALLFMLIPTSLIRELENRVIFYREKHLSRIAINRNRAAIGKQLYEISSVFREIQCTFTALGETGAEESAKSYIRACAVEETCKNCGKLSVCRRKNVWAEFDKLIDVGCLKGKISLIDLPAKLSETCIEQNRMIYAINRQLGDYRKHMLETENAANGRTLLAGQAQGVSEILKNLALEQSQPLRIYTDKERALNAALLNVGIVCGEVLIYGEENDITLSLTTFGQTDVKKIAAVAEHLFSIPLMISSRLPLSGDKFCCILRKKPLYDAAFGVSTVKKSGEVASGDTHSVIKIDERKFMVALSDGMGSGEYARQISESTISLLESFYRAKMPSDCVLNTVNKLLTFSREETFACVDIAIVDLDDGRTDIVKIGSPSGFILSGNTVKILESTSLPLGILDGLRPDAASYELLENDVLLFLSDGITGAFASTTDLYDVLKTMPTGNPQQLTDQLLERALQAYGGVAKDDMTAVAVRLFRGITAA